MFVQNVLVKSKLHFINIRTKGKPRQCYICLRSPIFTSQVKQVKAIYSKRYEFEQLTYMDKADKELRNSISLHINMLPEPSTTSAPTTLSPVPNA